jgi:hypothetical protein
MKARVVKYIKMPYSQFEKVFPKVVDDIKKNQPDILEILRSDSEYVVRITDGVIEFGYESDFWTIG